MRSHLQRLEEVTRLTAAGELTRMVGLTLEAAGCEAPIGATCEVARVDGGSIEAQVVGFNGDRLQLMPTGQLAGLASRARVSVSRRAAALPGGAGILGRVVDAAGRPLDGLGGIGTDGRIRREATPINPFDRAPIVTPLDVGVRTLNTLLPLGQGQRVGLFAGSGVGKSVLLGMLTRHTAADVVVVGLIGERGREVREFVEDCLGEAGLARAVVVASPADDPPLKRMHGALYATRLAEDYRAAGLNVLLLMDSLTRYAQAQREIALAIGEPPVTRGYPPSVFAKLPALCERAGNGRLGEGSITAVYTVLVEADDPDDPIADAARAVLDGHILLSRELANGGVYPAIDIPASASRLFDKLATPAQQAAALKFRRLVSAYQDNRDLVAVGAYVAGSDPLVDEALALWPRLEAFQRQAPAERVDYATSLAALEALVESTESPTHPVTQPASGELPAGATAVPTEDVSAPSPTSARTAA
ncbi:MAG: FliI/YscN family ATPase [Pseudomonadota bacterium]